MNITPEVGKVYDIILNDGILYIPMKVLEHWPEKDEYLVESLSSARGYFVKSHQMKVRDFDDGLNDSLDDSSFL